LKKPADVDWKIQNSKIVFFEAPGGKELFAMDAERFGLLLNSEHVRGLLQAGSSEPMLYPANWGLEKFVEAQRLLKKGLSRQMIVGLWGTTDAAVRAFYAAAVQRFLHSPQDVQNEWARQGSGGDEKDCCRSKHVRLSNQPGDEGLPGENFLEIPYVARLLKEFGSVSSVAAHMVLDPDDFKAWVEKNERYLALFGYKKNLF